MAKTKSAYRMGWILVMFDLPTDTKDERRKASRFRNDLLDKGYLMLQYSVYVRCAVTLDKKKHLLNEIKNINPNTGNIQCLFITDIQWGQITILSGKRKEHKRNISNKDEIGEQLQFW